MFRFFTIGLQICVVALLVKLLFGGATVNDTKHVMLDLLNAVSLNVEQKGLQTLNSSVGGAMEDLNDYQHQYLEKVLSQKQQVVRFYLAYCEGNDVNPIIYGRNLAKMCEQIALAEVTAG